MKRLIKTQKGEAARPLATRFVAVITSVVSLFAGLVALPPVSATAATCAVQSGTWGTVAWNIDEACVLHLQGGTGVATGNASPWARYSGSIEKISVDGMVVLPVDSSRLFYNFGALTAVEHPENLDTSVVSNMNQLFAKDSALLTLDLSSWDTAQVTTMRSMFNGAESLASLAVASWDTSKVTDMNSLFLGTRALTELNLSNWNTAGVTNFANMLFGVRVLKQVTFGEKFTLPVAMPNFSTTGEQWREIGCGSSEKPGGSILANNTYEPTAPGTYVLTDYLETPSVTTSGTWGTVPWCLIDEVLTLHAGTGTSTGTGTTINSDGLTQVAFESPWKTIASQIKRISVDGVVNLPSTSTNLFKDLTALTEITHPENLKTTNVTSMYGMFDGDVSLTSLDLDTWDTSKVTSMAMMFSNTKLVSLDLSGWDTGQVVTMNNMFYNVSSLATLIAPHLVTSKTTDIADIFNNASSLASLDVSGWDVSSVTTMARAFRNMKSLSTLNLSTWNTKSVIAPSGYAAMFEGDEKLTEITTGPGFTIKPLFPNATETVLWREKLPTDTDYPTGKLLRDSIYTGNPADKGTYLLAPLRIKVTYHGNAATTGSDSSSYVLVDPHITLTHTAFECEGYLFTGWNTSADGTGTAYDDEAVLTGVRDDIDLYAQWTLAQTNLPLTGGDGATSNSWLIAGLAVVAAVALGGVGVTRRRAKRA